MHARNDHIPTRETMLRRSSTTHNMMMRFFTAIASHASLNGYTGCPRIIPLSLCVCLTLEIKVKRVDDYFQQLITYNTILF